jgi:ABC-type phosphate transport system permease subunit
MSETTAQNKNVFWQSNWGRALYFSIAITVSIAYLMLLFFLVTNSMIDQNAFHLGDAIFWIPYTFMLFLAP